MLTAHHDTLPLTLATLLADLHVPLIRKPFDIDHLLDAIVHAERQLHMAPG